MIDVMQRPKIFHELRSLLLVVVILEMQVSSHSRTTCFLSKICHYYNLSKIHVFTDIC